MADTFPTTGGCLLKAPTAFRHTVVSQAFSQVLTLLPQYLEAERDIEDLSWCDPAFVDWTRTAEQSRAALLKGLDDVVMAHTVCAADVALRAVAWMIEVLILSTDPRDFAQNHAALQSEVWMFHTSGRGPFVARANSMLRSARHLIDELASLSEYGAEPEALAEVMLA